MYWLVSKCGQQWSDNKIKQMCEREASDDDSFESVFPILGTGTGMLYKNRYCAVCDEFDSGLVDDSFLTVDVSCDNFISVSTSNLLQTLKRENCTLVFKPSSYQKSEHIGYCYRPSYTISECNVTKHWAKYDKDIELACRSYIDPFNFTYKNYHCYVCNVETPQPTNDWKCSRPPMWEPKSDNFHVSLNLHDIRTLEAEARMGCDTSTQFVDYKKVGI